MTASEYYRLRLAVWAVKGIIGVAALVVLVVAPFALTLWIVDMWEMAATSGGGLTWVEYATRGAATWGVVFGPAVMLAAIDMKLPGEDRGIGAVWIVILGTVVLMFWVGFGGWKEGEGWLLFGIPFCWLGAMHNVNRKAWVLWEEEQKEKEKKEKLQREREAQTTVDDLISSYQCFGEDMFREFSSKE